MAYVKVDDQFPEHPKVMDIGPLAEALWLRGLCYASRNLTDGFIPEGFVRRMGDLGNNEADALIDVGLWDQAPGGYQMHDYGDWQCSREEIEELRQKRVEAGRRGGIVSGIERSKRSKTEASASQVLEAKRSKPQAYIDIDTDIDTERVSKPTVSHPPKRGDDRGFEGFWKQYPRVLNNSKAKALKVWTRLRPEEREAALAGLSKYVASDGWQRGFAPHTTTYLNGKLWDSDPPDARASPSNGQKPEERRPTIPLFEGVERKQMSPDKLAQVRREVEARRSR